MELEQLKSTWKKMNEDRVQNESENKNLILNIIEKKSDPVMKLKPIVRVNLYVLPLPFIILIQKVKQFKISFSPQVKHGFIAGLICLFVMLPVQNIQVYLAYIFTTASLAIFAIILFQMSFHPKGTRF